MALCGGPGRVGTVARWALPRRFGSGARTRSHAGDLLGDRVLDLDAGIHFDEVEAIGVEIVEELDRAGVEVVGLARDGERVAGQLLAPCRGERPGAGAHSTIFWLRRCTEQSRSKRWTMHPAGVGQDLHLQVPGPPDEPLEVDLVLPESGSRPRAAPRVAPPPTRPGVSTTRMPRPPPPQLALRMPGKPTSSASSSAACGSLGQRPRSRVRSAPRPPRRWPRAETLSPSRRRVSGARPDEGRYAPSCRLRQTPATRTGIRSPDGLRRFRCRSRDPGQSRRWRGRRKLGPFLHRVRYASSALERCSARRSSSENTATVAFPISLAARRTRIARFSPRFATRIFRNSLNGFLSSGSLVSARDGPQPHHILGLRNSKRCFASERRGICGGLVGVPGSAGVADAVGPTTLSTALARWGCRR